MLLFALPLLKRSTFRWWWLPATTSAASVAMLITMVTPPGWEIFDWYVS